MRQLAGSVLSVSRPAITDAGTALCVSSRSHAPSTLCSGFSLPGRGCKFDKVSCISADLKPQCMPTVYAASIVEA